MPTIEKIVLGCLGGLAAICVKFLGQDYDFIITNYNYLESAKIHQLIFAYGILTFILMFLGGLVAGVSSEDHRMKLLALSVAAPALITTWAGGNKGKQIAWLEGFDKTLSYSLVSSPLISSALADENTPPKQSQPAAGMEQKEDESTVLQNIKQGIKLFFGYDRSVKLYWVVVGSFVDRTQAESFAKKVNDKDQAFPAFVGFQKPDNPHLPVIIGTALPYQEAMALKERALQAKVVSDAYLSPVFPTPIDNLRAAQPPK